MVKNGMRNIVVLKNLPSNLVDEAIVIVKNKNIARNLEHIDRLSKEEKINKENEKDYIIKEAECVLSSYIEKIEDKGKVKDNINMKYKSLKIYSFIISFLFIILLYIR